ncbi:hypothetical protein KKD19_00350 [Patescibacteria group bacterium]|nr:hypothetical protein [Patescibacteria group bacterium]MBU4511682.1 hypothetical protein [Patescibacteria group bacterium]
MILVISFLHIIFLGAIDALIKGNIVALYNNNWLAVPWYWKDINLVYPMLIIGVLFGLGSGLLVMWKTRWGWKYLVMLGIWAAGGLESLSYWLWIVLAGIKQEMPWLPDDSLFWWYPKEAPWMNKLFYLKWLGEGENVTREAVLYGVVIAFFINLVIYLYKRSREASDMLE